MFCTVEGNYWQTRSIARPFCDSRGTCIKNYLTGGLYFTNSPIYYIWFYFGFRSVNDLRVTMVNNVIVFPEVIRKITSVSETIRNPTAGRSPIFRKTENTFCGTRVSVTLPKFCEKLLPRATYVPFTEIRVVVKNYLQRLRITFLYIWRFISFFILYCIVLVVRHLEFKKNHIWSCDCHRVPNLLFYGKFHQIRTEIKWRFNDLKHAWIEAVRHLVFSKFKVYNRVTFTVYRHANSASLCKISLKSDNHLLKYGRKRFFKMADISHLEFFYHAMRMHSAEYICRGKMSVRPSVCPSACLSVTRRYCA